MTFTITPEAAAETAINTEETIIPDALPASFNNYSIPLTGSALLAKVKELGEIKKSELVRACGYVSTKKDGSERLNFNAFYEALLQAKGMDLGTTKTSKPGRSLSYRTTVQFNGNLMIGKAYTALLDLKPGDQFEIKLGRKSISLRPIDSTDGED